MIKYGEFARARVEQEAASTVRYRIQFRHNNIGRHEIELLTSLFVNGQLEYRNCIDLINQAKLNDNTFNQLLSLAERKDIKVPSKTENDEVLNVLNNEEDNIEYEKAKGSPTYVNKQTKSKQLVKKLHYPYSKAGFMDAALLALIVGLSGMSLTTIMLLLITK